MPEPPRADRPAPLADPAPGAEPLRFVRARDPRVGFAESVAHLMTKPAFARAPFGHIARILAGQVGRGHYALVRRGPRTVGFVGWARADEAHAEAWLAGTRGLSDAEARAGDCALINCWQADDPAVSRFILARLGAGARRLPRRLRQAALSRRPGAPAPPRRRPADRRRTGNANRHEGGAHTVRVLSARRPIHPNFYFSGAFDMPIFTGTNGPDDLPGRRRGRHLRPVRRRRRRPRRRRRRPHARRRRRRHHRRPGRQRRALRRPRRRRSLRRQRQRRPERRQRLRHGCPAAPAATPSC